MSDAKQEAMAKLEQILSTVTRIEAALSKTPSAPRASNGGVAFPNYGRSKGAPVAGATKGDLDYYRSGCERTLSDPTKEKWHERERVLLAAIDAELAAAPGGSPPPGELAF